MRPPADKTNAARTRCRIAQRFTLRLSSGELPPAQRIRRQESSLARRGSGELSVAVAVAAAVVIVVLLVVVLLVAGVLWWRWSGQPPPAGPRGAQGAGRQVDPALVRYIELVSWPVALGEVHALAVGPADQLYVAGAQAICVLNADGRQRAKFALPGEPYCLAAAGAPGEDGSGEGPLPDAAGSAEPPRDEVLLYVGLGDHLEVWSAEGQRLAAWDAPAPEARFTSIAVSGEHVFVADAGSRVVWHYDRQGAVQGEIGRPDRERRIPGFLITSFHFDLAVGGDGLLYVVNPRALRLEAYTLRGDLEAHWGRGAPTIEGFFGCCNPAHFSVLPDGRFVTVDKGLPHVKVYSPEGRFECVVAAAEQVESLPADLAADSRGRVLVLDGRQKAVRVFSPLTAAPKSGGL